VRKKNRKENAVSEIVGEMLMLTMVLIILAVFSSSLSNYLPPPRDPSVTIKMDSIVPGNVTLHHDGGDIIKKSDLSVIVENNVTDREKVGFTINSVVNNPELFGLGDTINISTQNQAEITLTTSRTVLFKGTAMGV
jgi:FlaG/FlaF family flagellin (archaellin)